MVEELRPIIKVRLEDASGVDISAANPLEVHDPKVGSLISYEGTTTANGGPGGATLVCSDLMTKPDFDGNLVIITSGAYQGQARDINGVTTGGTVTPSRVFGGIIVSGTKFVIAGITTTPAEVAAIEAKLDHAAHGLAALKTLIDAVEGKLDAFGLMGGAFTAVENLKAILGNLSTTKRLGQILGALDETNTLKAILGAYTAAAPLKTAIDGILEDTGTTLEGKLDTIKAVTNALPDGGALTALLADIDDILEDTSTTLEGKLDNLGAFTGTENLKAILGNLSTTKRLGQILGGLDETDTLKAILGAFTATENLKAILGNLTTTKNLGGILGALDTTDNLKAILGAYTAAAPLKDALAAHEASQLTSRGVVDNIILDTQVRRVASGIKAINAYATKYLHIDSGTNGAEILAIIIKGVVGADWTIGVYVPTNDAVAAPAAGDKRDSFAYVNTDTKGGLLGPLGIAYNMFLNFTNDSGGADNIDDCVILYRSRAALTLGWEA